MEPDELRMDVDAVKVAINNLLWMYAAANVSLGEAEERACEILQIVMRHATRPQEAPDADA